MRTIILTGHKPDYDEIKCLRDASRVGYQLREETMHPLNTRWDHVRSATCVFLDDTFLAQVAESNGRPVLNIRSGYPQRFDHALITSLNGALADVNDLKHAIALKTTMEAQSRKLNVFTTDHHKSRFIVRIHDRNDLIRRLYGAEAIDRTFVVRESNGNIYLKYKEHNRDSGFFFNKVEEGFFIEDWQDNDAGINEQPFLRLLDEGASFFSENFNLSQLVDDAHSVLSLPPVDEDSINLTFSRMAKTRHDAHYDHRSLSALGQDTYQQLRHNGILVFSGYEGGIKSMLSEVRDAPEYSVLMKAFDMMALRWKTVAMGSCPERYPLLDENTITERLGIAEFDFG